MKTVLGQIWRGMAGQSVWWCGGTSLVAPATLQGWGTLRGGWHRAGAEEGDGASGQHPPVPVTVRTQLPVCRHAGVGGVCGNRCWEPAVVSCTGYLQEHPCPWAAALVRRMVSIRAFLSLFLI